jgi:hypothetical protein
MSTYIHRTITVKYTKCRAWLARRENMLAFPWAVFGSGKKIAVLLRHGATCLTCLDLTWHGTREGWAGPGRPGPSPTSSSDQTEPRGGGGGGHNEEGRRRPWRSNGTPTGDRFERARQPPTRVRGRAETPRKTASSRPRRGINKEPGCP